MKMNINIFYLCAFIAMLFYGIVTLLPSRSTSRKKQKRKISKLIEPVIAIIISMSGLLMIVFSFVIQNEIAQMVYIQFKKYCLVLGLLVCVKEFISKIINKGRKHIKSGNSIIVEDIEIIYGVTTPQVFSGSKYRVAYETMVQEAEIPFITCELQVAKDNKYIGDLFFEQNKSPISVETLKSMPISEIHLDK